MISRTLEDVKKVYSFWGSHSWFYGLTTFLTFLGQEKYLRKLTVDNLELKIGDWVLDLACGTGRNFPYLEKMVGREGFIIGFDYSPEMLQAAQKRVEKQKWANVKVIQGDAAELKISEKGLDGAISILGLSAVPDHESAIRRIYDLLKPKGILAVCDARLFEGGWRFLNPLVEIIYGNEAAWDWRKDIVQTMREVFGNVQSDKFLGGAFYIARSVK